MRQEDQATVPSASPPAEGLSNGRLAAAVGRLDQRSRLLLYLSVGHRIPDGELADFLGTDLSSISRERARSIERITDDLGMTSVTELAEVLAALPELPQDTWGVPAAPVLQPSGGNGAVAGGGLGARARSSRAWAAARELAAAWRALPLERMAAAAVPVAALSAVAGAVVAAGDPGGDARGQRPRDPSRVRTGGSFNGAPRFVPLGGAPLPEARAEASTYPTARLRRPAILRSSPGGKARLRASRRTEFGSPRVLAVVRRRGAWLGVQAAELGNGEIGWIRRSQVKLGRTSFSLHADLTGRELSVFRGGRLVRRVQVTVGAAETPTPTGRFAVTDRLRVNDPRSPYGCCVIALTGHQPKVPEDWPGGDRLAIHATRGGERPGRRSSLGCMRAVPGDARWLMRTIPLGSPVFVRYGPPGSADRRSAAPFPAR